jgi:lysozyme family protein
LLGYRWPTDALSAVEDDGFAAALQHVLALEGGFVDDPADPGGPTRAGITLPTLAEHLGMPLDATTRAALRERLMRLGDEEIAAIYRQGYWRRAGCHLLPSPIALMHFDAAVNQGPVRAIRMLQTAVDATVDGEIGPETLGRCHRADTIETIERYAAARRAAYRKLSSYARFGRGWLARVRTTERAAKALAARLSQPHNPRNTEKPDMQAKPHLQKPKWWGGSVTIWGVLITALTAVLPALAPLFGLEISAELAETIGRELTNLAQGGGGLLGTAIAIYGRLRARGPLIRKRLSMTV